MTTAKVELPPKLVPVFAKPRGSYSYRAAFGGRGSAKSFSFAKMAAVFGYIEPLRILCTREFQVSIKESFHAELKAAISSEPWLAAHYDIGESFVRGANGTEFLFKGLRHNIESIKSLAGIGLTIIEESETVPEDSWRALIPTVMRTPGAEIWAIWNPCEENSATDKRFRQMPPPRSRIVELNYRDNPWFPPGLEEVRQNDLRTLDPALYAHIWEGAYLAVSNAQVFAGKWRIDEFEPGTDWDGPYFGLDFGFANDPTAAVKLWIHNRRLYVEREGGRVGLELDDTAPFLASKLGDISGHTVRADCSRPESISFLKRNGLPRLIPAKKWPGSVEDGITHMRSYDEIVVHPRCEQVAQEMRLYSYKTNEAGDPLPIVLDKHNHYIDAIRYGLEPIIGTALGRAAPKPKPAPELDPWGRAVKRSDSWKTL